MPASHRSKLLLAATAFGLLACSASVPTPLSPVLEKRFNAFQSNFQTSAQPLKRELGEFLAPKEAEATRAIEGHILDGLKKSYVSGPMKRDVHTKHHGCVKAVFKVDNSQLPPALRVGVLAQNQKEYLSWVRFSNGSGDATQPDSKGDVRGMAVKLMGVPGQKLLPEQAEAQTQDFLLMNSETFFIQHLSDYVDFSQAVAHGGLGMAQFALTHPRVTYRILKIFNQKISNPLETPFFSATAYQLGPTAIKFKMQPCRAGQTPLPAQPGPDYLRQAMTQTLQQEEGCFDFMVQARQGDMPVEDATVSWDTARAPYVRVARLLIPRQRFDSPEQMNFCENMSYTPWHSLPAHTPLGATNRVRKTVYELISKFRHEFNGVERREPVDYRLN